MMQTRPMRDWEGQAPCWLKTAAKMVIGGWGLARVGVEGGRTREG
jgi:hypothetical protein